MTTADRTRRVSDEIEIVLLLSTPDLRDEEAERLRAPEAVARRATDLGFAREVRFAIWRSPILDRFFDPLRVRELDGVGG